MTCDINITYYQLLIASPALAEVNKLRLPIKKARKVFDKIQEVTKELEFYRSEENKISDLYCLKNEQGNVVWNKNIPLFENKDNEFNWNKEVAELQKKESKVSDKPIQISDKELGIQPIESEWIGLLNGIVEFTEN
jgi:hypothetical protein